MKPPNRGGFVLLEVMLALVVLTGGVAVLFQSFRASLRTFDESHELFSAGLLMESQIAVLKKTGQVDTGLTQGSSENTASWDDEVMSSDPWYGQEHLVTLRLGEGPRSETLEQTVYVAK
jgi:hypothetical protein